MKNYIKTIYDRYVILHFSIAQCAIGGQECCMTEMNDGIFSPLLSLESSQLRELTGPTAGNLLLSSEWHPYIFLPHHLLAKAQLPLASEGYASVPGTVASKL